MRTYLVAGLLWFTMLMGIAQPAEVPRIVTDSGTGIEEMTQGQIEEVDLTTLLSAIQVLVVADITDPDELEIMGGEEGDLIFVYQVDLYGTEINGWALYRYNDGSPSAAVPPVRHPGYDALLAAPWGTWEAVSGQYQLGATNLLDPEDTTKYIQLDSIGSRLAVTDDGEVDFVILSASGTDHYASVKEGSNASTLTEADLSFSQSTNALTLSVGTLTADRTFTFPDDDPVAGDLLTAINATTTTWAPVALPAHGAASRIWGSGSGGTTNLDLLAERGLSIDADGVGIMTDGVTVAMLADFAAASRIVGSGSGGAAAIELVAEDGLDIDANGIGVSAAGITPALLGIDQAPQFANRDVAADTADTATSADHTIRLLSTSLLAPTTNADLYDPTGLETREVQYILTATITGSYAVRDHLGTTLYTLTAAGSAVTVSSDPAGAWYVIARI